MVANGKNKVDVL